MSRLEDDLVWWLENDKEFKELWPKLKARYESDIRRAVELARVQGEVYIEGEYSHTKDKYTPDEIVLQILGGNNE